MKNKSAIPVYYAIAFIILYLFGCQTNSTSTRKIPIPDPVGGEQRPSDGAAGGPPTEPKPKQPTLHAWQFLEKFAAEENGYGLYTYVLTGRNSVDSEATSRYSRLVSTIRSSTSAGAALPPQIDKSALNIFLIPATLSAGAAKADQELAKTLLTAISSSSGKDFSGPGPFLFSIRQPVRFVESGSLVDMLYVDLTNIHEEAFAELVRLYKTRVTGSAFSGTEKLSSFKISLLNAALIAEDSIGFVKVAKASFRDAFTE